MSRDNENKQNNLAELKLEFSSPITLSLIMNSFEEFMGEDTPRLKENLKKFLIQFAEKFFKAIQLDNITKETLRIEGFIDEIKSKESKKFIKFDVFENGDYNDANRLLQDIYNKWNNVQLRKELCSDHIILIKKAIMYLTSLKKIVSAFIQDKEILDVGFKNQAEAKQFIELVTVSIDSYIEVLKNQITELSSWIDNIITTKVNMLMRAESSLRLLSKYAEWDKNYNDGCGDTEQKIVGNRRSGDFNIEKV